MTEITLQSIFHEIIKLSGIESTHSLELDTEDIELLRRLYPVPPPPQRSHDLYNFFGSQKDVAVDKIVNAGSEDDACVLLPFIGSESGTLSNHSAFQKCYEQAYGACYACGEGECVVKAFVNDSSKCVHVETLRCACSVAPQHALPHAQSFHVQEWSDLANF